MTCSVSLAVRDRLGPPCPAGAGLRGEFVIPEARSYPGRQSDEVEEGVVPVT